MTPTGPPAPLLELREIRKSFAGTPALRGVSLDVRAGEVHALVGANGAGKSTLIKILAGACPRDGGEIRLDGAPARIDTPQEGLARGIAVIYQEFNLAPQLTVAENILLGQEPVRRIAGLKLLDRSGLFREGRRHVEALGFPLDPRLQVSRLGTGEQQLVEIARALHRRARVLVLDEPTAALSRAEAERLFGLMEQLRRSGIGMIYISHHLEEVFRVADRITALRDGAVVRTWERGEATQGELARVIAGRAVEAAASSARRVGAPRLSVRGLWGRGFAGVDLEVAAGEIVALVGAAGAGQSELLRALAGAEPPAGGAVEVDRRGVRLRSVRDAVRAGILLTPGDRKRSGILPELDVRVNFTFAELERWRRLGVVMPSAVTRAAAERVERYGVACRSLRQEIRTLSGGNQQKVVVGRAAERRARVFLFDEPTRGVDVGAREEIYALMHRLAEGGAALLAATPDLQEALRLGDRVGVMRGGRLRLLRPTAETGEDELLAALLGSGDAGNADAGG